MNQMQLKKSILCAGLHSAALDTEKVATYRPKSGDAAVFEVVSVGRHKRLQIDSGRNATLFSGSSPESAVNSLSVRFGILI